MPIHRPGRTMGEVGTSNAGLKTGTEPTGEEEGLGG
jgi:hypothetical protein